MASLSAWQSSGCHLCLLLFKTHSQISNPDPVLQKESSKTLGFVFFGFCVCCCFTLSAKSGGHLLLALFTPDPSGAMLPGLCSLRGFTEKQGCASHPHLKFSGNTEIYFTPSKVKIFLNWLTGYKTHTDVAAVSVD